MVFAAITANSVQKRMGSHNFPLPSCSFTQARYVRGMVKPFGSSQDRWRAESTSPSRLAWQGEALCGPEAVELSGFRLLGWSAAYRGR